MPNLHNPLDPEAYPYQDLPPWPQPGPTTAAGAPANIEWGDAFATAIERRLPGGVFLSPHVDEGPFTSLTVVRCNWAEHRFTAAGAVLAYFRPIMLPYLESYGIPLRNAFVYRLPQLAAEVLVWNEAENDLEFCGHTEVAELTAPETDEQVLDRFGSFLGYYADNDAEQKVRDLVAAATAPCHRAAFFAYLQSLDTDDLANAPLFTSELESFLAANRQ